ncbi:hypothetical protein WDU94_006198 [Cyamophila willieti]
MERSILGFTRRDRKRNTWIRAKTKVTEVSKKIQERRLQWYGHVERRDESYIGKRIENIIERGRKGRGRPKKRWRNCVNEDLREKSLSGNEAHNRTAWKRLTKNADPV